MISVFQHLDDPLPLPEPSREQRAAVIARGEYLWRRHRAGVVGLPLAAAIVVASALAALAVVSGPAGSETLPAAAPAGPELTLQEPATTGEPARLGCIDPAGDSVGGPDVAHFSLDRPMYPLVHYGLVSGEVPSTGLVELRFEATSADRGRSRHLVQRIADGSVIEQYLLDPSTGARRDVPHTMGGAGFPGGALSGLGDGWTWVASLSLDGRVVDSCGAGSP